MAPFSKKKPKKKPTNKRQPQKPKQQTTALALPGKPSTAPVAEWKPRPSPVLPELRAKIRTEPTFDPEKSFLKTFKELTYRHRAWDIWNDFVVMSACALSNPVDKEHYDEREERYLRIIKKYSKEEQNKFPELFAQTVMALELNPEQDFLGRLYTSLNLHDEGRKQHFTPYSVCEMMADVTLDKVVEQVRENGYISINDSCCGAGATLIAAINSAKRKLDKENLNFQNHILVAAQDIDETVALMCYIQLSLLGVAAYIKVGNALTEPMNHGDTNENYWFTPMYFSNVWSMRRLVYKLDYLFQPHEKKDFKLRIKLEESDCQCDIHKFYMNVAKKAGIAHTESSYFDCTKIRVTGAVKDAVFDFYRSSGSDKVNELVVMWISLGPKADLEEDGYAAEIENGFVIEDDS